MSGDAEDFEAMEHQRQAAERMCGWNGSLERWEGLDAPPAKADPMPDGVRERLAAAREAALARYKQQKARGLCL